MRIDDYELEHAVKVLWKINPSVSRFYATPEDFRTHIIKLSRQYMETTNNFSTAGFCLTSYKDPSGETVVRVSIHAFTVAKYIEAVEANANG